MTRVTKTEEKDLRGMVTRGRGGGRIEDREGKKMTETATEEGIAKVENENPITVIQPGEETGI